MNSDTFFRELERLKSQWPQGYGKERERLLFQALRDADGDAFHDAVSELLVRHKGGAPLLDELTKATNEAQSRKHERGAMGGFLGVLHRAQAQNFETKAANPELAAACVKLVSGLTSGRYTKQQFEEGCDVVEHAFGLRNAKQSGRDRAAGRDGE